MRHLVLLVFLGSIVLGADTSLADAERVFEARRPREALPLYRVLVEEHRDDPAISVPALVRLVECYQPCLYGWLTKSIETPNVLFHNALRAR
jgi:hypothetical protein